MKKLLFGFMSLMLLFGVTGCGKNNLGNLDENDVKLKETEKAIPDGYSRRGYDGVGFLTLPQEWLGSGSTKSGGMNYADQNTPDPDYGTYYKYRIAVEKMDIGDLKTSAENKKNGYTTSFSYKVYNTETVEPCQIGKYSGYVAKFEDRGAVPEGIIALARPDLNEYFYYISNGIDKQVYIWVQVHGEAEPILTEILNSFDFDK